MGGGGGGGGGGEREERERESETPDLQTCHPKFQPIGILTSAKADV